MLSQDLWKYIPKKFEEAIESADVDEDGYWIYLNDGWNADGMDEHCHVIHENSIKDLKMQISQISWRGLDYEHEA